MGRYISPFSPAPLCPPFLARFTFCFKDSATARATSSSTSLPEHECKKNIHELAARIPNARTRTRIHNILPRPSWVRVAFCFKDSARARAPSAPTLFLTRVQEKHSRISSQDSHRAHTNTNPRHTFETQPGEGCVLLQGLGQSPCSLGANDVP